MQYQSKSALYGANGSRPFTLLVGNLFSFDLYYLNLILLQSNERFVALNMLMFEIIQCLSFIHIMNKN